jgi:hypothetical protein
MPEAGVGVVHFPVGPPGSTVLRVRVSSTPSRLVSRNFVWLTSRGRPLDAGLRILPDRGRVRPADDPIPAGLVNDKSRS